MSGHVTISEKQWSDLQSNLLALKKEMQALDKSLQEQLACFLQELALHLEQEGGSQDMDSEGETN